MFGRRRPGAAIYPLAGVVTALALWQVLTSPVFLTEQFSRGFSPANTLVELILFVQGGGLARHAVPSLSRVGAGLAIATAVGVPIGVLVGYSGRAHLATNVVFQFVRMTSPLAWMPIAIIVLGVGGKPVTFLIALAAMWPIIINTAHGVRSVNPVWVKVVRMLGGDDRAVLRRAVAPAIVPDALTGLRIAIGIAWIVLVPAEMLGVSSGMGYYILDTRDRFNYGELMAVILVVGAIGFVSDAGVRWLQRACSWKRDFERGIVF